MELNKKLMELNKKLPLIKDNMDVDISKKTNLLNDITRLKKLSLINTVFEDDEVINLNRKIKKKCMGRNIKKICRIQIKIQKPTYVLIILPLDITSIGNTKENFLTKTLLNINYPIFNVINLVYYFLIKKVIFI